MKERKKEFVIVDPEFSMQLQDKHRVTLRKWSSAFSNNNQDRTYSG